MSAAFQVNPLNETVDVEVLKNGSVVQLYWDQAASEEATSPVAITAPTTFYVAAGGTYQVSLKIGGNEYATTSGLPLTAVLSSAYGLFFQPVTPINNTVVDSFNTLTGEVTLTASDVTGTGVTPAELGALALTGGTLTGGLVVEGAVVKLTDLPTSDPHVVGQLYSLLGVLHVSAG